MRENTNGLTVFCLETIAMNITPWKRKSRCQKPRKFFFNKDHRTAEKHRLLYGRAGSGTFHYKKGDSVTSLLLLPSFFLILTHLGPYNNISWGFSHCVIFTRRSLSLSLLHCYCLEPGLGIRSLVFRAIHLFFVSERAIRSWKRGNYSYRFFVISGLRKLLTVTLFKSDRSEWLKFR